MTGTAAHYIGEDILNQYDERPTLTTTQWFKEYGSDTIPVEGDSGVFEAIPITSDMLDNVQLYVDFVRDQLIEGQGEIDGTAELLVEQTVSLKPLYDEIDINRAAHAHFFDQFGTADAIVITDDTLHVIDYKNGFIEVVIVSNTQLLFYLLGVIVKLYGIKDYTSLIAVIHRLDKNLKYTVFQPNDFSWEIEACTQVVSKDELLSFAKMIRNRTIWLSKVKGYIALSNDDYSVGDHCEFCEAMPICSEFTRKAMIAVADDFDDLDSDFSAFQPPSIDVLNRDQIADIVRHKAAIEKLLKSAVAYVDHYAREGDKAILERAGMKFVEQTKRRKYKDNAMSVLIDEHLYSTSEVCESPKLMGLTRLEKIVGKSTMDEITFKPKGDIVLTDASSNKPDASHLLSAYIVDDFDDEDSDI